ncbi:hypothetical protein IE53DRAFT_389962 [Violaceomyces palustris]|uniref:Uncharacterized protein n=1 Tax=Violaceomyces palustris TaxID=1673888 RepID=A0ACD0NQ07_9BASI|nr:hypothetical protein IE53DRAFT_389962 [Violaceomyces palustris]
MVARSKEQQEGSVLLPSSTAPVDDDELERFRREWKQEVDKRAAEINHHQESYPKSTPRSTSKQRDGDSDRQRHDHPLPTVQIPTDQQLFPPSGAVKYSIKRAEPILSELDDGADANRAPMASHQRSSSRSKNEEKPPISPTRSRSSIIAGSAFPFSHSTSSSRPLAPKTMISGSNLKQKGSTDTPSMASDSTQGYMKAAVEVYATAVEMERSGRLNEALISYRKAFKLDSNADKLYHRAHTLLFDPSSASTAQQGDALLSSQSVADKVRAAMDFEDVRVTAIKRKQSLEAALGKGEPKSVDLHHHNQQKVSESILTDHDSKAVSGPDELTKLLSSLSIENGGERDFSAIRFEPLDEELPVRIAALPDEVILLILSFLAAPRGKRGAKVIKPKPPPDSTDPSRSISGGARNATASSDAIKSEGREASLKERGEQEREKEKEKGEESKGTTDKSKVDSQHADETEGRSNEGEVMSAASSQRNKVTGIGMVLGGPDWMSLETVARVCWKFRLLTRSPTIWKRIVTETYYPPQVEAELDLSVLHDRHHCDWRSVFVNQPRVRMSGAYIAACHYARPGMSEESVWIRVVHVVEFYRSIRFLPDGRCLSLLTTDPPSETVRKLEPNLKCKGFAVGRWELFPQGLEDDEWESRPDGPKVVVEDLRDKTMAKYAFRMVFQLRQTARGRWNKLDLLEYFSVNLTNGEVLPLPQKHSKPFHFSRVLPYGI